MGRCAVPARLDRLTHFYARDGGIVQSTDNFRGYAGYCAVRGDGRQYDAACGNFGELPDADIAENGRACADQYAVADFRMAIAAFLASPTQGDLLQNRYIVADDGGFADDDAGGMVEHDAIADRCGRMDVDTEAEGAVAGERQGEVVPILAPQCIADPMELQGMKAFLVEHDVQQRGSAGIASYNGGDVARGGGNQAFVLENAAE